jgi:hypothetical protein
VIPVYPILAMGIIFERVERTLLSVAFDLDLDVDLEVASLPSLVIPSARRRVRNLLSASSATNHVATAASAVQGAKRRQASLERTLLSVAPGFDLDVDFDFDSYQGTASQATKN